MKSTQEVITLLEIGAATQNGTTNEEPAQRITETVKDWLTKFPREHVIYAIEWALANWDGPNHTHWNKGQVAVVKAVYGAALSLLKEN